MSYKDIHPELWKLICNNAGDERLENLHLYCIGSVFIWNRTIQGKEFWYTLNKETNSRFNEMTSSQVDKLNKRYLELTGKKNITIHEL